MTNNSEIIRLELIPTYCGKSVQPEGSKNPSFEAISLDPILITQVATIYQTGRGLPDTIEIYFAKENYYSTVPNNRLTPLPITVFPNENKVLVDIGALHGEGLFNDYTPIDTTTPLAEYLDGKTLLHNRTLLYQHKTKPKLQITLNNRPNGTPPGVYLTLHFNNSQSDVAADQIIGNWDLCDALEAISHFKTQIEKHETVENLPLIQQQTILKIIFYSDHLKKQKNTAQKPEAVIEAKNSTPPHIEERNSTLEIDHKKLSPKIIIITIFIALIALYNLAEFTNKSKDFKMYDPSRMEKINKSIEAEEIRNDFNMTTEEVNQTAERAASKETRTH